MKTKVLNLDNKAAEADPEMAAAPQKVGGGDGKRQERPALTPQPKEAARVRQRPVSEAGEGASHTRMGMRT